MIRRLSCLVDRGIVRAELHSGRKLLWAAEGEWADHALLAELVAALAGRAELPAWGRSVRFVLRTGVLQRRDLAEVPPVGRGQLSAMVALTPQRYFRRNGVPLVTSAGWAPGRGVRQAIGVAAELTLLQALVSGAGEAGLTIDAIEADIPVRGAPLSLLPPDEELRRKVAVAGWTRRLGVAAVVAWAGLGVSLLVGRGLERRRVEARLEEIGPSVAAILAAEAGADSVERMVARLQGETRREGEVVSSLYRVALALPDSAFLTQLRVDSAGFGLVAGAARRPAAVLAALESRAGLTAPRFSGRTTPDMVSGRPVDRFAIGFGAREVHP